MKLTLNDTKYVLPKEQYFEGKLKKDKIVLHFTAGSTAEGAYQSWLHSPVQVATAYIVDKDGAIYQTFDPRCWAYHLGIQKGDPNHYQDKQSIGIEIVNEGPLRIKGDKFLWWPNDFSAEYHGDVKYLGGPWRGFQAFAEFPSAQSSAVCELVVRLSELFDIPKSVINGIDEYLWNDGESYLRDFRGIVTHSCYRKDKYDIGPAWDWRSFIESINR